MPNPLKYFEHGKVHLITTSTEEGLPFSEESLYKPLCESIMARAQHLYPVHICGYTFMANHFHMLLVPIDPEDTSKFVGYVKQELSHAVNRLEQRNKKTIWCDGYDSPLLLGYEDVVRYFEYLYTQAQCAHQADTIEEYRGATSWHLFMSGIEEIECPRRRRVAPLVDDNSEGTHSLKITPYVWLKRYTGGDVSEAEFKKRVIERVRAKEAEARKEREDNQIPLFDKTEPERATSYIRKARGRRSYVISSDVPARIRFLLFIREQKERCREVYRLWKQGVTGVAWPSGFYLPCMVRSANLLPWAV
jgi:REP element-mobilizing transposase RayT